MARREDEPCDIAPQPRFNITNVIQAGAFAFTVFTLVFGVYLHFSDRIATMATEHATLAQRVLSAEQQLQQMNSDQRRFIADVTASLQGLSSQLGELRVLVAKIGETRAR